MNHFEHADLPASVFGAALAALAQSGVAESAVRLEALAAQSVVLVVLGTAVAEHAVVPVVEQVVGLAAVLGIVAVALVHAVVLVMPVALAGRLSVEDAHYETVV